MSTRNCGFRRSVGSPPVLPIGQNGPEFPGRDAFNATWAPQWDSYLLAFTVGSLQQYSRQGRHYYFNSIGTTDKAPRFQQCFEDLENGRIRHTNILGNGQARVVELLVQSPMDLSVIFQDDTYSAFKTDVGDRSTAATRSPRGTGTTSSSADLVRR